MADKNAPLGPVALIAFGVGAVSFAATVVWFSARPQGALIYGLVRSIELPFLNRLLPYAEYFSLSALRQGVVPPFTSIYWNSLAYGLFFTAMILVLCVFAIGRIEKHHVKRFVEIDSPHGRSFGEIMKRYAVTRPDVQFFLDYDLIELSTLYGTGRQPMTALDFLLYTGALRGVSVDYATGAPPSLVIDEKALRNDFTNRLFGPKNPFLNIPEQRLIRKDEIEGAVDTLRWDVAIMLYAALWRYQAFFVEADSDGYKSITRKVETYLDSVWSEINELKQEFGPGIALGYDSSANRSEREQRYKIQMAAAAKKEATGDKLEYAPSIDLENLSHWTRVLRAGQEDRQTPPEELPAHVLAYAEKNAWKGKGGKKKQPDELLFIGEVLSVRGPGLKVVEAARAGLKQVLTRHLGMETKQYPVRLNAKTKEVEYASTISDGAEQAFNNQAQQRLNDAAAKLTKIVFGHAWQFGIVGSALENVRQSGIMPPNHFRFLRFSRQTEAMWWFVQNVGMPSAFPESAAMFEHFNAETATGMALQRPYIVSSIEGLKIEAEKYLTNETKDELIKTLGDGALFDQVRIRREAKRDLMRKMAGQGKGKDLLSTLIGGEIYDDAFFADAEAGPKKPKVAPGQIDPVDVARHAGEELGIPSLDVMRNMIIPRSAELAERKANQARVAEREQRKQTGKDQ